MNALLYTMIQLCSEMSAAGFRHKEWLIPFCAYVFVCVCVLGGGCKRTKPEGMHYLRKTDHIQQIWPPSPSRAVAPQRKQKEFKIKERKEKL